MKRVSFGIFGGVLLAALVLLGSSPAAACTLSGFQSSAIVEAGGSYSNQFSISNLAFGQYFVQVSSSGGGLFNLGATPFPGFVTSNGTRGFTGSGATVFLGFFIPSAAAPGTQSTVTFRVIDTAGREVCRATLSVSVPAFPAPTGLRMTFDGDEEHCTYWDPVPGAQQYYLHTLTYQPYRILSGTGYCRELKPKYLRDWKVAVSAYSSSSGEGARTTYVNFCDLNPGSPHC